MSKKDGLTEEERAVLRQAAQILNKVKTPARIAAAQNNGKKGGRPKGTLKPLKEIPCTCGGGEDIGISAHPTTCPRGRAIRYRAKNNLPISLN